MRCNKPVYLLSRVQGTGEVDDGKGMGQCTYDGWGMVQGSMGMLRYKKKSEPRAIMPQKSPLSLYLLLHDHSPLVPVPRSAVAGARGGI